MRVSSVDEPEEDSEAENGIAVLMPLAVLLFFLVNSVSSLFKLLVRTSTEITGTQSSNGSKSASAPRLALFPQRSKPEQHRIESAN